VFHNVSTGDFQECRFCPTGASCPALSNITVSPQYYAVINATTLAVETFLCGGDRCASNGACAGSRDQSGTNPLCGRCVEGYSEWNGDCIPCSGVNGGLVVLAVLLAWACVLVIHIFSQSTTNSSALRITLYLWQVSILIVDQSSWLRWANFMDLNIAVAGTGGARVCPFPISAGDMLLLRLLGPLLCYILLAATMVIHAIAVATCGTCRRTTDGDHEASPKQLPAAATTATIGVPTASRSTGSFRFDGAPYIRSIIALYFFTFNQILRQCFEFFNCVTLPGGGSYMFSLPALACDSSSHAATAPLVWALLFVYGLVVPVFITARLWSFHRQRRLDDDDVGRLWGGTYQAFRADTFWWGTLQIVFRASLVAVAVFVYNSVSARFGSMSLLNVSIAILQRSVLPNKAAADNVWESISLMALVCLSILQGMAAPDAWTASVMLGVGTLVALRMVGQKVLSAVNNCRLRSDQRTQAARMPVSYADQQQELQLQLARVPASSSVEAPAAAPVVEGTMANGDSV
jgi:hypothetical protein